MRLMMKVKKTTKNDKPFASIVWVFRKLFFFFFNIYSSFYLYFILSGSDRLFIESSQLKQIVHQIRLDDI